jgi:hypothetical protein
MRLPCVVRVGALYSLEKIGNTNSAYHKEVLDVLCAYVRLNSPLKTRGSDDKVGEDIQTALTIIGRYQLDKNIFHRIYNKNISLIRIRLKLDRSNKYQFKSFPTNVSLTNTNLKGAILKLANLRGADF